MRDIIYKPQKLSTNKRNGTTSFRVDLNVRYEEKNEAKKLGARWDSQYKTWYVIMTESRSLKPFSKWIVAIA